MPYLQPNIPRPNRIYNFSLSDFSGGLNNRKDILDDNESPDMLNMIYSSEDILSKRHGQKYYDDFDYKDPITFIDEYIGAGTETVGPRWGEVKWGEALGGARATNLVVATDSELYINGELVRSVTSTVEGVSHLGNYYFVDGGNMFGYGQFPKVEGTYIKVIGTIPEDSVLMEIVSPKDDYEPLDREELDETVMQVIEIGEIGVRGIEVKLDDGNWYWMDRGKDGKKGVGLHNKYVVTFSEEAGDDGRKTVFFDEVPNGGPKHLEGVTVYDYENNKIWYEPCLLEVEDEFKGANVVPSNTRYIVSHKGRLFTSGDSNDDNNIFMTDLENPFYFPVGLPVQIPPDSDKIISLIVYDDSVLIGRRSDIYVLRGETNRLDLGLELFNLQKLNTHTGLVNSSSSNLVHNNLFFIGDDGNAYSLGSTRRDDRVMATTIVNQSIDFKKDPININNTEMRRAVTHFYDDKWWVQIGEKTLVFDYRNMTWVMLDGLVANSWSTINYNLVWGSEDGRLVEFTDDYLDFGEYYDTYWKSKHFDVDEPSYYKHFKQFYITSKVFGGVNSVMSVGFIIDHKLDSFFNVVDPSIGFEVGPKWGESNWGMERFYEEDETEEEKDTVSTFSSAPYYINRRGKHLQIKITSGPINNNKAVDLPAHLYSYTDMVNGEMVYVRLNKEYYVYNDYNKYDYIPDYSKPGNADKMVSSAGWRVMYEDELNIGMQVTNVNFNYEERGRYLR